MRFSRKKNFRSWDKHTSALAHEAKARKRMEGPVPAYRISQEGAFIGVLQWETADGVVRRWEIRRGTRANNLSITALGKTVAGGWDKLLTSLRKRLAVKRSTFEPTKIIP